MANENATGLPQTHPDFEPCRNPKCVNGWVRHTFSDPTPCKECGTTGLVKKKSGWF